MDMKRKEPRNAPKPGHRMPGGTYVDTRTAWEHFTDVDTPTDTVTPSTTTSTDTGSSPTSGE